MKYTALDSTFERPYVEITVGHKKNTEPYLALVDSGADISETFYMHPVTITVEGITFKTEAAFADLAHLELAGLVGQRGFFSQFHVSFDFESLDFELKAK